MGSVVISTTISLDGYVAGPNHEMDWIFDGGFLPDEPIDEVEELIDRTGAIITGRNSYDVGERASRTETSAPFGGRWSGPQFVLTHRPPAQPSDGVAFLSGDIGSAVTTAREAAGGRDVLVLGADVAQRCFAADLVDELFLVMLPVVLGDGIRLFGVTDAGARRLSPLTVKRAGDAVLLRFGR